MTIGVPQGGRPEEQTWIAHRGMVQKGIHMASVSLLKIIEKMKLENLTPEIDLSGIKITQPDINRPALQLAG